jgi:hypothetical protein
MRIPALYVIVMILLGSNLLNAREYHVSVKGKDADGGTTGYPFRTISKAASVAMPGDVIVVHAGVYREWINPKRGGESDSTRIVYKAAEGEKVEIKGSEIITGWIKEKSGIWKVTIPNSLFGDYNPYQDSVYGDWFNRQGITHHTGEVFLNGKSLYEVETILFLTNPEPLKGTTDTEGSMYRWYCESGNENTTIWANFGNANPNRDLVEITTRRTVFWPDQPEINYITISGFDISQAATQWAAPTAEQVGIVSTNWNRGWIIENCSIHDSKCAGITLGKEKYTGHNVWSSDTENVNRDGNIHFIEVMFRVIRNGWDRERVGSHIIRNNTIYNCEQAGICGSFGAIFCRVERNRIYKIWTKRQFSGAEIAGIKFHAAIDTYIGHNHINSCGRGIWLDWMTQGTRVSSNLLYNNNLEDIFLEVNHGPFVVDNNILLSPMAIRTQSQGGAFLHNLIAGDVYILPEPNRFTPYFLAHTTDLAGLTAISGGDDRYFNNIFAGRADRQTATRKSNSGLEAYENAKLPVWISDNLYLNGARPSPFDRSLLSDEKFNPGPEFEEIDGNLYLHMDINELFLNKVRIINSEILGRARIPKEPFDNPDYSDLVIDRDYHGARRTENNNLAGPFTSLSGDHVILKVW